MLLNIQAPINRLSYGIMSTNIIKEFVKLGIDINLFPIGQIEVPSEIMSGLNQDQLNKIRNSNNYSDLAAGNSLKIYHTDGLANRIGKNTHIGYTTFELDDFTGPQKANLVACDKVMTASTWGKWVLDNHIKTPTSIARLGVDRDIFNENISVPTNRIIRSSKDNYVFLHVGKAEKRKSTLEIIAAFNMAFSKNDDVELWMCIGNKFLNTQEKKYWENQITNPDHNKLWYKTRIIQDFLPTQNDVAQLMIQSDCGVFISAAEGWNMPALEIMSCGKQIIGSYYSAHTDFMNDANSMIFNPAVLEIASDNKWFTTGIGKWAKIGLQEIASTSILMQTAYKQGKRVNNEGIKTAKNLTWEKTAISILNEYK